MRLIDADALRDALGITGTKESCKGCQYNKRFNFACNTDSAPSFAYVCEAIDDAPTVDAVPVIRCKDCTLRTTEDCPVDAYLGDDGYCSWGQVERKEE